MDSQAITDKEGEPIHVGDTVYTKIRGGSRQGEVNVPVGLSTSGSTDQFAC